jgi:hypothetical protein
MRRFSLSILLLLTSLSLAAQKESREPLTSAQIEEIREAAIYPDQRVALYVKFLNEHAETIGGLAKRAKSSARQKRMESELLDFTTLMDECGSNLDQYAGRHADLRKSLKSLVESSQKWQKMLQEYPSEAGFELSLKEAQESARQLADQAAEELTEQTEYFKTHKEEKGQDRAEPQ